MLASLSQPADGPGHAAGEPSSSSGTPAPLSPPSTRPRPFDASADVAHLDPEPRLSAFETIFSSRPPVLDSLLSQLPTEAIFALYHTSPFLRRFLRKYPLAWLTLSFRLPQAAVAFVAAGHETPDPAAHVSKSYALDALLKQVVHPYGHALRNLDLCNTAVSGVALVGSVLVPRARSLRHLSVRGCKNVSIKYHIIPFLEPYAQADEPWPEAELALRSLYAYRCRHHRRRPYLPSSLTRRDSDSEPTHQLVEICHALGIWTDTAWCPTPGARCFRRKDYHHGRASPGAMEVWVPFDRLWRSGNRIGPTDEAVPDPSDGRLWETAELGHDGEPLGPEDAPHAGESKHTPAHLRRSHRTFVDRIQCSECGDAIHERCESCSVRMHCMGCRKTLCASCAFNRPLPRKRAKPNHFASLAFGHGSLIGGAMNQVAPPSGHSAPKPAPQGNRFWWAPGAARSPNLMNEALSDDESSEDEDDEGANHMPPPQHSINHASVGSSSPLRLNMQWCCLEPMFSGGGGIAMIGNGLGGKGSEKIRAAPLPRRKHLVDPDFSSQLRPLGHVRELKDNGLYEFVLGEDIDMLALLQRNTLDLQVRTSPRALCQECYRSFRWKVSCRGCRKPLCKEHDFRALKVRRCGYRDLLIEREYVRLHSKQPPLLEIPAFKGAAKAAAQPGPAPTADGDDGAPATTDDASGLLSHSQTLPRCEAKAVGMSASASQTSLASTADASVLWSLPNLQSPSPAHAGLRPRSHSASGLRSRSSSGWMVPPSARPSVRPFHRLPPLPCQPRHPVQWQGCGAFFCIPYRPIGDIRPRCPSTVKECSECNVHVCPSCEATQPECPCRWCQANYHCPLCSTKAEVQAQCRFEEEVAAERHAQAVIKERLEREKAQREHADHLAETVWEFWEGLMGSLQGADAGPSSSSAAASGGAPNTSSGAAITVTTEFGVEQEPSNVTVVSSAAPASAVGDGAAGAATPLSSALSALPMPLVQLQGMPSFPLVTVHGHQHQHQHQQHPPQQYPIGFMPPLDDDDDAPGAAGEAITYYPMHEASAGTAGTVVYFPYHHHHAHNHNHHALAHHHHHGPLLHHPHPHHHGPLPHHHGPLPHHHHGHAHANTPLHTGAGVGAASAVAEVGAAAAAAGLPSDSDAADADAADAWLAESDDADESSSAASPLHDDTGDDDSGADDADADDDEDSDDMDADAGAPAAVL